MSFTNFYILFQIQNIFSFFDMIQQESLLNNLDGLMSVKSLFRNLM